MARQVLLAGVACVIPRMVSGPDYDPQRRWRRDEHAPYVDIQRFVKIFLNNVFLMSFLCRAGGGILEKHLMLYRKTLGNP